MQAQSLRIFRAPVPQHAAGGDAPVPTLQVGDRVSWRPRFVLGEQAACEGEVVEIIRTLYSDLADEEPLVRVRLDAGTRVVWPYELDLVRST